MEWVETIINDESIFPVQVGTPFPKNFRSTCKKLLSRLYRVFVHVYVHHFDRIVDLQAVMNFDVFIDIYYFINCRNHMLICVINIFVIFVMNLIY